MSRAGWTVRAVLLAGVVWAGAEPVQAEPPPPQPTEPSAAPAAPSPEPSAPPVPPPRPALSTAEICVLIEAAAEVNGLPAPFFVRLIWRESRFDPAVVSHKGAQGIAQFMPSTAAWRGLADPFDPIQAIPESAAFLRDLRRQFGNLGLAAAAYNAGPGRVADWLAGRATLPAETRAYVLAITGTTAEVWARGEPPPTQVGSGAPPFSCAELAASAPNAAALRAAVRRPNRQPGPSAPWGVQLAGNFSEARALASFQRIRARFAALLGSREPMLVRRRVPGRGRRALTHVRIGADSRPAAERICADLRAAGGSCIVLRN